MKIFKTVKEVLKNKYFNWALVVIVLLMALYFSSSAEAVPGSLQGSRLAHAFEYAVISLLIFRALYASKVKNAAIYAAVLAVMFGVLDEIYQISVPGRVFEYGDIIANSVGAIGVQLLGKIRKLFLD